MDEGNADALEIRPTFPRGLPSSAPTSPLPMKKRTSSSSKRLGFYFVGLVQLMQQPLVHHLVQPVQPVQAVQEVHRGGVTVVAPLVQPEQAALTFTLSAKTEITR